MRAMPRRHWNECGALTTALALLLPLLLAGCGRGGPDQAVTANDKNNMGTGLMGMFRYQEAHDVFAALVQQHPDWHEVKVNLAIATLNRQREGDEARALELLREVIARQPKNLRARYCAGLLLYRAGDPAALEHLEFVARSDPDDPYAAYYHGSALEQAGRTADAEQAYRRAVALDPYLRSASYRLSQILPRSGRAEDGAAFLEDFKRLADNPRARTVDFIYSKMGPKSEAIAIGLEAPPPPAERPPGAPFAASEALVAGTGVDWAPRPSGASLSVTAADIDGDGRLDLFFAGALRGGKAANAVIRSNGTAGHVLDLDHPLAAVTNVNAALWGDYDNDGLTDVYLCRRGPNQLMRQSAPGQFTDVTQATGTSGGNLATVDGALFDADHDGDLDIFCVNADGPNELFSNNLDGTFRAIASSRGIAGSPAPSRQVLVADLDRDRDLDIVVINQELPHEVYLNDRLWAYRPAPGFDAFINAPIVAAAAGDRDADGRIEIETIERGGDNGRRARWTQGGDGTWSADEIPWPADWGKRPEGSKPPPPPGRIALADVDGDGTDEVLLGDLGRVTVWKAGALIQTLTPPGGAGLGGWAAAMLDTAHGPSIVAMPSGQAPITWGPGPGRFDFAAIALSGLNDKAKSMRSNASGIGARLSARIDSRWTVAEPLGADSGPGQSLQPVAIGLGGSAQVDFVSIDWPDGVLQSEVHGVAPEPSSAPRDFSAGRLERITELQRQTSSCPVLFAWDGEKFAFVSDLLGVGGLGYLLAPGEYSTPRPWENFLMPQGLMAPRGGHYALKLTEPMEEACYLDEVRLTAWDLPPEWNMTLDERMAVSGPLPTGEPRFYRQELLPSKALTARGEDVTELVASADLRPATVGEHDPRFIGRLREPNMIALTFDEPLDARAGQAILIADGWIEYPYSQTMFAAWQAGAGYAAPTVEARGEDGAWHIVLDQFGYPAGMPRQMSVELTNLPRGTTQLRITTNQEIYWDRLAVAFAAPDPPEGARRHDLPLQSAVLERPGFPKRTTGPEAQPYYDFNDRSPLWDARRQRGDYTAFGAATDLVARSDGALAIFGPGEGMHLQFAAPQDPPPPNWTRRLVLESRGWCKDMDLFTRDGETLAPLPGSRDQDAESLHQDHNTRPE